MNQITHGRLLLALLLVPLASVPGEAQQIVNQNAGTVIDNQQLSNQQTAAPQLAGPRNPANQNFANQFSRNPNRLPGNQVTDPRNATSKLLLPRENCFHVIRLLHLQGVNRSFDVAGQVAATHHPAFGMFSVPPTEIGDLRFVQITHDKHDDDSCGPRFLVTLQNNSLRDIGSFHVTLVATLGRLYPDSPTKTVRVDRIAAGTTLEICIQLPIEAWSMGNRDGRAIGFQTVVVAIDAFDELAETDEANNLKAFNRRDIPIATVIEQPSGPTVEEVVGSTTVGKSMVNQPTASNVEPPQDNGNLPGVNNPSGGDNLRRAIRMLNTPSTVDEQAVGQKPGSEGS